MLLERLFELLKVFRLLERADIVGVRSADFYEPAIVVEAAFGRDLDEQVVDAADFEEQVDFYNGGGRQLIGSPVMYSLDGKRPLESLSEHGNERAVRLRFGCLTSAIYAFLIACAAGIYTTGLAVAGIAARGAAARLWLGCAERIGTGAAGLSVTALGATAARLSEDR